MYRFDGDLEYYKTTIPGKFDINRSKEQIMLADVIRTLQLHDDGVAAFNNNNEYIVVVTPTNLIYHEFRTTASHSREHGEDIIRELHSPVIGVDDWEPIGFIHTELICEGYYQKPNRLLATEFTGKYSDMVPGVWNATPNPPLSLYGEMLEHGADYAYIDGVTGEHVFGNDPNIGRVTHIYDNKKLKETK